jgi:threonine aldolase
MSTPPLSTSDSLYADFRSDTVTKPTAAMRQAIFAASVGDDVFGDDETVNTLQIDMAALIGKESSLFLPSGTMSNLLAALCHCNTRGSEMIVGDESHMFFYEQGNAAQFGGIQSRTVKNQTDGTMKLEEIERAIRVHGDVHQPITQLICVENTQNRYVKGGRQSEVRNNNFA